MLSKSVYSRIRDAILHVLTWKTYTLSCRKFVRLIKPMHWLFVSFCLVPLVSLGQAIPKEALEKLEQLPPDQRQKLMGEISRSTASFEGASTLDGGDDGQAGLGVEPVELEPRESVRAEQDIEEVVGSSADDRVERGRAADREIIFENLERFGSNIFSKNVSTFAPVDNIPVPAGYVLGTGDSVSVVIYGNDNLETTLVINREGQVNFPLLGPIVLAGFSWDAAREYIEQRVKDQLIGTSVSLSLGRLRSINLFVAGEVASPGNFAVSALTTITQAIYVSGGISEIGSYRNIQVRRDGQLVATLDLYDLLLKGSLVDDLRLQSGDVVFVPVAETLVGIAGAINRPNVYELANGESVRDLLRMAGGLKADAIRSKATLRRLSSSLSLPYLAQLDLNDIEIEKLGLANGDSLYIDSTPNKLDNPVFFQGAVERQGMAAWLPNSRISRYINDLDRDLSSDVDLSIGLIARRLDEKSLGIEIIQFNPQAVIEGAQNDGNPVVYKYDEIYFFSLNKPRVPLLASVTGRLESQSSQLDRAPLIEVIGAIKEQGKFPIPSGSFHVSDLIRLIGGESALDIDVDLKASLLVSRQSSFTRLGVKSFSLEKALEAPHSENDPSISALDRVFIFELANSGSGSERSEKLNKVIEELVLTSEEQGAPNILTIAGEVYAPGVYPLINDGDLLSQLQLAGGVTSDAYTQGIEIQRKILGPSQNMSTVIEQSLLEGPGTAVLRPRDFVTVKRIPGVSDNARVTMLGEVRFPGVYGIAEDERLSSVIERAGGLKPSAFARGAVYTNEQAKLQQLKELDSFLNQVSRYRLSKDSENIGVSGESYAQLGRNTLEQSISGRIVIDLEGILAGEDVNDPIMYDGDRIEVPNEPGSISILGEVFQPSTQIYEESFSFKDYLELAGGPTKFADIKRAYVIAADGKIEGVAQSSWLLSKARNEIKEGDTIVVPTDLEYEKPLEKYGAVTSVIFQSVASIAAFFTLSR